MQMIRRNFLSIFGLGMLGAGHTNRIGLPNPLLVSDDDFWAQVRAQYPLTRERVYLNTGGLGPAPYTVIDAVQQTTMNLQRVSEHGHKLITEARPPIAAFLGAPPETIAFTRNATEANATVASGLTFLQPGDEVILESHAHPGGAIPWMSRQKQQGIRVRAFDPDPEDPAGNIARIEALLTPRTRVVQVSHITAPTGIVMPVKQIAELAAAHNLWFHLDGAQSAGAIPVDLVDIGCDSFATSGHKWMGATHGTGLLYIKQDRLDEVMPTEVGAYSDNGTFDIPDQFEYNPTAVRYECGTRDAAKIVGFKAAVDMLQEIGMARVAAYGKSLGGYLQSGLREIDGVTVLTPENPAMRAGITTFQTAGVPCREMYRRLVQDYKLRCRIVTERGLDAIRVSTHIFNNKAECDLVRDAVQAIAGGN